MIALPFVAAAILRHHQPLRTVRAGIRLAKQARDRGDWPEVRRLRSLTDHVAEALGFEVDWRSEGFDR